MGRVIDFPPKHPCAACGAPLRPATRAEFNSDRFDPRYRHIAESAAQGARDWEPPDDWSAWEKDAMPPGSWLLRCDRCGNRTLWAPAVEV